MREPTEEWVGRLLESMQDRVGALAEERDWTAVAEWKSFSARFVLIEGGGDQVALKLGTNWNGEAVRYVAAETKRVEEVLANLHGGKVAMPRVLGVVSEPPALALEHLPGEPLFQALPTLAEPVRSEILRLCGAAIGAYHAAQEVPEDAGIAGAAMAELRSAARRSLIGVKEVERRLPFLGRARSYRFSPNDFLVTARGSLVLLDPPHVQKYDYVHRDIATFFMELHRALAGEGPPASGVHEALRGGRASFLEGYRESGPMALDRGEDRWAIDLFQTSRVVGVVRNRIRSGLIGSALRALSWAFWLRRRLGADD